jgi:signal transduction histidine kinase
MAAEGTRWSRLGVALRSVRARATAGAVLVVGVALIGASLALVAITQQALESHSRSAARLRAHEVALLLARGTPPDSLQIADDEDVLVQVVDGAGLVLASTPRLRDEPPLADLGGGDSRIIEGIPDEDDDPFVVVAEAVRPAGEPLIVLVGRSLDSVRESSAAIMNVLLAAVPVLLIIVGVTTWAVVGRALAPVEAIRREVAEISAAELHRRVPLPQGDDEIARLARTMNAMLVRLDEAQTRQRRLISDASHELRSPIAAIRHAAEVSLAHPDGTTVGEVAADILQEDLRLERLAENLLLLARADEHTLELTARPLDLDDLVLAEARRLKQVTELRIDTTRVSAARTRGDGQQLQRVLRNLTDNAARYAIAVIALGVREVDGDVVLEIDDDGPGVPAEMQSIVFDRFTRLDDARGREFGGAGLGLAIVAEIVAAHGGTVSVGDAPLGGARFSVVLPRLTSDDPPGRRLRQPARPAT